MAQLRDLIYFDFDKAASIYSQLHGGLREKLTESEDRNRDQTAGVKFGIPKIAEANLGADWKSNTGTIETKVLHHDLLILLEEQLLRINLVTDLMAEIPVDDTSASVIRDKIGGRPYVIAEGNCAIEDYQRIVMILQKFNQLIEFIGKCNNQSATESPEYKTLSEQIADARRNVGKIKDRNQKAVAKNQLKTLEQALDVMGRGGLDKLDDWLIDGIQLWINTFMPNRINLRVYPFRSCPSFQVICNLKRDCFVDEDLEHLLYGYGNLPNVPLGVIGLITSIPPTDDREFDPLAEFADESALTDKTSFENAIRRMFGAMDEIEDFMRYSRYPNITVHPIAVYRQFNAE